MTLLTGDVVYLGGPMRGLKLWNFPAFHAASAALRAMGLEVRSPAEHDESLGLVPAEDGTIDFPVADCLSWDYQQIIKADAMVVLPGWETSTGTHFELTVASSLGKPVFQYPELTPVELPTVVTNPVGLQRAFSAYLKTAKTRERAERSYAHVRGVDGPGAYAVIPSASVNGETMRTFDSGATRHSDDDKLDYEGFLSPAALRLYAEYLHKHRRQADGQLRDSDNWQKGIPLDVYAKSEWRHHVEFWAAHRAGTDPVDAACAILFNVFGYLHEYDKADVRPDA